MTETYEYNLGIRFQNISEHYASKVAIWLNKRDSISYGELNRMANRIARWLIERGITPGDVICLSGIKSIYTFACVLACLKVGATYSVFDPDSPVERLRKIFSTCRPRLLLAESNLLSKLDPILAELEIIPVIKEAEKFSAVIQGYDDSNLPETRAITGTNPAYIMYTSGSTGIPKGALITHANVLNLIEWSGETYSITPADILTNVNPLYFDNSVFDLYSALFTGAMLIPFSKEEARDPKLLVEKIDAAGCTQWFSVPSLLIFLQTMKATDGKHLRSIRRFIFGGEGYPKAKLKKLYDVYSDTSEFFNVSGPTECTCICSSYKLTAQDFIDMQGLPPLGSILNEDSRKVADGELGELCLLGPNVGKGYYNDPDRTALGFVQNPYNNKFQEIMYKTGDLVRLDPDNGKLYIYGRKDNQIKHMGYRIELEEIEAALHRLDYISEAAALHSNATGLSRIVAVVASRETFEDEHLRMDLKLFLPDYMIPSVFYREDTLPKNPNGKVDRRQLTEKYLQQKP
jgi:D-alanine--poly(phosphoribitol) ligase subunit 1